MPVEIVTMLQGPELGHALRRAMEKKGVSQQAVADHFQVKQPSVSEWLSKGRIAKKHIPRLVEFFSEVVGPEHWGLPASWTTGAPSPQSALSEREHDLLAAFRLLGDYDQHEVLAKAVQMALDANPGIAKMMQMAGVSTRADDAAVLEWWHRTQEKAPRQSTKETPVNRPV